MEDLWTKLEREKKNNAAIAAAAGELPQASSGVENNYLVFLGKTVAPCGALLLILPSLAPLSCAGDNQSGKSSLIQTFLKPSAAKETKPTIALEYNFARRTANNTKSIANLYEIGGDFLEPKLLEVVVDKNSLSSATVCLCIDLSKPHNAIIALLRHLTILKEVVGRKISELQATNVNVVNTIRSKISAVYATHADAARIRPLELNILVIANKFGALRNLQSGEKRLLLQTMRFICHYFGISLLCTELNDSASKEVYRNCIGNVAFGIPLRPTQEINDKFVFITRGMDTYESILLGPNLAAEESGKVRYRMVNSESEVELYLGGKGVTRDCWKRITELSITAFGEADPVASLALNSEGKMDTGEDENAAAADNPFPEAEIDDMRAAKDAALARYVQDMERKRDMLAKMNARSREKEKE